MEKKVERGKSTGFSSPLIMAFCLIAGSVGTGNIWRFPRVAATNGGGAFVIAYVLIMIFAIIPLMMGEHVIGRATRRGLPGAFKDFIGTQKSTWFGSFVWVIVFMTISYYTVVISWVVYYLGLTITNGYIGVDKVELFNSVSNGNITIVLIFIALQALGAYMAYKGVTAIEKSTKVILPILFLSLIGIAIRTVTLPGASLGLNYLFDFKIQELFKSKVWLEALTQTVWSAGPGWGICIAYGVYAKQKSDISLSTAIQGFGDMGVALLSGVAIIPAIFAMSVNTEEAMSFLSSGNNGLAFVALTGIFERMQGGQFIGMLFFVALIMAGFSSLIAMYAIIFQPFNDARVSKKKTAFGLFIATVLLGAPSAWTIKFFDNQDFVVGMGMVIGAIFSSYAITRFGAENLRVKLLNNRYSGLSMGKWWNVSVSILFPIMAVAMLAWWLILSIGWSPDWWNPFGLSIGTLALQLGGASIVALLINTRIANSTGPKLFNGIEFPPVQDND